MSIIAFKNVEFTVNSVVLSDRMNACTINFEIEQQDATVMGGNRAFVGGIQNNTVEVTLYQDFSSANVEATIFPLVGEVTTLTFKPDASAAVGVANPVYTITGAFLSAHTPIAAGDVGATSPISLSFTGGTLVKTTA